MELSPNEHITLSAIYGDPEAAPDAVRKALHVARQLNKLVGTGGGLSQREVVLVASLYAVLSDEIKPVAREEAAPTAPPKRLGRPPKAAAQKV